MHRKPKLVNMLIRIYPAHALYPVAVTNLIKNRNYTNFSNHMEILLLPECLKKGGCLIKTSRKEFRHNSAYAVQ